MFMLLFICCLVVSGLEQESPTDETVSNCKSDCRNGEAKCKLDLNPGVDGNQLEDTNSREARVCENNMYQCEAACEGTKYNQTLEQYVCYTECDDESCNSFEGEEKVECKFNEKNCWMGCEGKAPLTMDQYKCIYPSCLDKVAACREEADKSNSAEKLIECHGEFLECQKKCLKTTS